jgi:hypothetical protein
LSNFERGLWLIFQPLRVLPTPGLLHSYEKVKYFLLVIIENMMYLITAGTAEYNGVTEEYNYVHIFLGTEKYELIEEYNSDEYMSTYSSVSRNINLITSDR